MSRMERIRQRRIKAWNRYSRLPKHHWVYAWDDLMARRMTFWILAWDGAYNKETLTEAYIKAEYERELDRR